MRLLPAGVWGSGVIRLDDEGRVTRMRVNVCDFVIVFSSNAPRPSPDRPSPSGAQAGPSPTHRNPANKAKQNPALLGGVSVPSG